MPPRPRISLTSKVGKSLATSTTVGGSHEPMPLPPVIRTDCMPRASISSSLRPSNSSAEDREVGCESSGMAESGRRAKQRGQLLVGTFIGHERIHDGRPQDIAIALPEMEDSELESAHRKPRLRSHLRIGVLV